MHPGDEREKPATAGRAARWRAVAFTSVAGFLLHGIAVLWVWRSWQSFGRSGVLAWIDFPSSLALLRLRGGSRLVWSLLVGGLQWGLIGAALSVLVGRAAQRPPAE